MREPVVFQAIFHKAQTLVDGGWRVTLDLSEFDAPLIAALVALKNEPLTVTVMTEEMVDSQCGKTS